MTKTAPPAERAWRQLEAALAVVLADLGEDDVLVVSQPRSGVFVQFTGRGAAGMRAEAVGNAYLGQTARLSTAGLRGLERIGWHPPAGEILNFSVGAPRPVPYGTLARMAAQSLMQVYRVRHPRELQYEAFDLDGAEIRFPTLRLKRHPL